MKLTKSAAVSFLLFCAIAQADHVPPSYMFNAVSGRNAAQVIKIDGHSGFEVLPKGKSNLSVNNKMDDLVSGLFSKSLSGIVIDKDEIIYEKYKRGLEENPYPVFSITKSVTSLMVGYALCQGLIKDINDKASDYLPQIKGTAWGDASVINLLKMKSGAPRQGLDPGGTYMSPSGINTNSSLLSGGDDVISLISQLNKLQGKGAQDLFWTYNSFDTLTLALVIEAASKKRFVEFYKETLWRDFKPEHPTYWFLDRMGNTLADGYFHMSLRDAARLGMFVLKVVGSEQTDFCLKKYILTATQPHTQFRQIQGNKDILGYGYQFWLEIFNGDTIRMSGHQGQEIMINFKTNKVVAMFSSFNSARDKIYLSDGIFKWLSTVE